MRNNNVQRLNTDTLSIAAWNVCGLKQKSNDLEFLEQLSPHDIIILTETFSDNDTLHIPGYKSKNIYRAKKHKKAKRNSGGVSVLIKLKFVDFITVSKTTAEHFIWLKICKQLTGYPKDTYCCCSYIPPYGSPYYTNHPDCNLFDSLNADLTHFCNIGHIILSGDLNARIANKADTLLDSQTNHPIDSFPDFQTITPPPRHSMDSNSNAWGNKLIDMCIAHNLCLLNGRTIGDLAGNYTFFGGGRSVIDLTIVDEVMLNNTLAFKVHPFLPYFSSHCKIETILRCSPITISENDPTEKNLKFIKYYWNKELSQEKLTNTLQCPDFLHLKNKILTSNYPTNKEGTESLCADVDAAFKLLHEQCCDKTFVGKKSRAKAKRQKWFTQDLSSIRKKLRRAANHLHRNPNDVRSGAEVSSLGRKYNKLLKKTKKLYLRNNMQKLINTVDKQEMWSILSDIKGKKSGTPIPMKDLHDHFHSILNNSPKNVVESKLKWLHEKVTTFKKPSPSGEDSVKEGGYTPEFISKIAKTLKNGKSAFTDGSINEIIKHSIASTSTILAKLFDHIEFSAVFPTLWKSSFLVPIHKKGSQGDANNYRGLAIGSNIAKLYTKCLNSKVKNFVDTKNLLSPHQFAFRDDFRTSDAIFSLSSMVSHYKSSKKAVYACFVDFSKAFDSVNRTALYYKLGKAGVKGKILQLIEDMYTQTNYVIKAGGAFSVPITSSIGVKQGCNLSPLLFNLFLNDIHSMFPLNCKALNINSWNVNSLSFADDLVLLSETENGLRNCITTLEVYCNEWGLKVNPLKTNVLVFNKSFSKNIKKLSFAIDGNPIAVTNSYCYLGIEMTNTCNFTKATDILYKKALRALFSIYSSIDIHADLKNVPLFLKLFDSLVKPVLLYGSEIWGSHIGSGKNPIAKFINKFHRTLLGVPRNSSNTGTLAELGCIPIEVNVHQSMIKYWFRLISLPPNRLAAHCYWTLLSSNAENHPWLNTIKSIMESTRQYSVVWNNQKILASQSKATLRMHENTIVKSLNKVSIQQSFRKISEETKLAFLSGCKTKYALSNYLNTIQIKKKRSLLSKLRLGTLDLEIEKSRRHKIPRAERICKLCSTGIVEDEIHFILNCPILAQSREPFLNSLATQNINFLLLSPEAKVRYLFFNEALPDPELIIAVDMLASLKNERDALLNLA